MNSQYTFYRTVDCTYKDVNGKPIHSKHKILCLKPEAKDHLRMLLRKFENASIDKFIESITLTFEYYDIILRNQKDSLIRNELERIITTLKEALSFIEILKDGKQRLAYRNTFVENNGEIKVSDLISNLFLLRWIGLRNDSSLEVAASKLSHDISLKLKTLIDLIEGSINKKTAPKRGHPPADNLGFIQDIAIRYEECFKKPTAYDQIFSEVVSFALFLFGKKHADPSNAIKVALGNLFGSTET